MFTVKFGYRVATLVGIDCNQSSIGCDSKGWKCLWSLKILSKIKICLWRTFLDALPMLSNLIKRQVYCPTRCPWCGDRAKTSFHVFWSCHVAKQLWSLSLLWVALKDFDGFTFGGLCLYVLGCLSLSDLEIFCCVCWSLWGA